MQWGDCVTVSQFDYLLLSKNITRNSGHDDPIRTRNISPNFFMSPPFFVLGNRLSNAPSLDVT